jgi:hypothetical protein
MPKFYRGSLSSSSGQKVTNIRQAKAIAASERENEKEHGGVYREGKKPVRRFHNQTSGKMHKRVRNWNGRNRKAQ